MSKFDISFGGVFMEFVRVNNVMDAKFCDQLLSKLIQSERQFNRNIRENYVVSGWFEKVFNEENNVIFVAKFDGVIVGYVYCKIISSDNGPTVEHEALIDGLFVEENFRKQGIASALLKKAKEWARTMNVKYLFLNVLDKNKDAMRLYYKNDFEDFEKKLRLEL